MCFWMLVKDIVISSGPVFCNCSWPMTAGNRVTISRGEKNTEESNHEIYPVPSIWKKNGGFHMSQHKPFEFSYFSAKHTWKPPGFQVWDHGGCAVTCAMRSATWSRWKCSKSQSCSSCKSAAAGHEYLNHLWYGEWRMAAALDFPQRVICWSPGRERTPSSGAGWMTHWSIAWKK